MSPEAIFGALFAIYLGGLVVTGMVCAFGAEAFYWDGDRAIETAILWPLLVAVVAIMSPFLLASFLGSQWRRLADAKKEARSQDGTAEPIPRSGRT